MLVTLGNNQSITAQSSQTFTYSPNSVQKVFIRLEDADWEPAKITVQIGSTTICNGISAWGLSGLTGLYSTIGGVGAASTAATLCLDFGNHECVQNDNLYVTIQAGSADISAVDVSALVDEPVSLAPLRFVEYSDNTFTSENNLLGMCWDAGYAEIEEDTNNCEIRTSISSSAPSFTSASSFYSSSAIAIGGVRLYGLLNRHQVPLKTTYNYVTNVVDRILTVEQMGESSSQRQQANRFKKLAVSQAGK